MYNAAFALAAATLFTSSLAAVDPVPSYTQKFTTINGQVHTPGHVIVNSPQPWTPVGGDSLHISLDVSANGKIGLPPYKSDAKDQIHEIALFLTSRITGLNLTISNPRQWLTTYTAPSPGDENDNRVPGALKNSSIEFISGKTTPGYNQSIILYQEPSSTVKHIDFRWPKCLADADAEGGAYKYRDYQPVGAYNISIHQHSTIGGEYMFSVFDLPIIVKDDIPKDGAERFDCFDLQPGYGGTRGKSQKYLSTWFSSNQTQEMDYTEYPWVGDKADERTSFDFNEGKVEEYVKWPRGENEEQGKSRVVRDTSYQYYNGLMDLDPPKTATIVAGGARQTAAVMGVGAMAAAGLAMVL